MSDSVDYEKLRAWRAAVEAYNAAKQKLATAESEFRHAEVVIRAAHDVAAKQLGSNDAVMVDGVLITKNQYSQLLVKQLK